MQIPRKMVSAEPRIAFHGTETSIHDQNILFDHSIKYQATWCTGIRDMKKSVILRDILWIAERHAPVVCRPEIVWLIVTTILQLPNFWTGHSGFPLTPSLHTLFKIWCCSLQDSILSYPYRKSDWKRSSRSFSIWDLLKILQLPNSDSILRRAQQSSPAWGHLSGERRAVNYDGVGSLIRVFIYLRYPEANVSV